MVRCSPAFPAFSLQLVVRLLQQAGLSVATSLHHHSSLSSTAAPALLTFLPASSVPRSRAQVRLTVIWSEVGRECEVMVSPLAQTVLQGEVNLLRYLARLFPSLLSYETQPGLSCLDSMLDTVSSLLWAAPRDRQPLLRSLAGNLTKQSRYLAGKHFCSQQRICSTVNFLPGETLTIADLALYSVLKQLGLDKDLQPDLARWFKQFGAAPSPARQEKEKSAKKEMSVGKGKSPSKEVKAEKKQKSGKSGKENTPPTSGNDPVQSHLGKQDLFQFFQQNDIKYHNVDHPEVFTVEAMMPYLKDVEGAICKNLFLKDKKKNFYLLSARHDKEVKLNDVAKAIGAKELRFADENVMFDMLGVRQGCVTAYALVNDTQKLAKFIVDKTLLDQSKSKSVNFHPLVNTATTGISCQDFKKFLSLTGHVVLEI